MFARPAAVTSTRPRTRTGQRTAARTRPRTNVAQAHALEPRRMLSAAAADPLGRTVVREFEETVAGFRIDYQEWSYGGSSYTHGALWIYGPATDDDILVSRNTALPNAVDFDFNGTRHTIDFDTLARGTPWGISAGDGKNRLEVTFAASDGNSNTFSGFQLYGGAGDDEIINGDTSAVLRGEAGDDVLRGGAANDTLEGGEGIDKLYGGLGDDYLSTGMRSSPPGPGEPYPGPYLEAEEGEVYDGGPGDDMFQAPPAPAVPLPDGGQAPDPAGPEAPPPRSEPYPQPPPVPAGTPTSGLEPDAAFDGDGRLTLDVGRLERAITVEPLAGGKFLVGGFAFSPPPDNPHDEGQVGFLLRVNPDGTLDRGFGNDGVVVSRLFEEGITDIVVRPDGKILAAGMQWVSHDHGGGDLTVARFNPDGSLDAGFGEGGRVLVDFYSGNDRDARVGLGADGKIVLAGSAGIPYRGDPGGEDPGSSDVGVARFNPDGTPDQSFDDDGKLTFDFRLERKSSREGATAVAVSPGGKVVLSAHAWGIDMTGAGRTTAYLIRLNPDGTPDASFSGDGMVTMYERDRQGHFGDLVLRDDGSVTTTLNVATTSQERHVPAVGAAMLVRFAADGTLDGSFGTGGAATVTTPGTDVAATNLRARADGTLGVAGWADGKLFLASFDAADGRRLRFDSGAAGVDRHTDVPFAGAAGEVVVAGRQPLATDGSYPRDSDTMVSRFKVTGDPAPVPDPDPEPDPDPAPPRATLSARFSGARAVTAGSTYTFHVTYRAAGRARIDLASVGDGDATVTGPRGFSAAAVLVSARPAARGVLVRATYRVSAPGGAFDVGDNGTYTVRLEPGAVAAIAAEPAARSGAIRRLTVAPPAPPAPVAGQVLGRFVVRARTPRTVAAARLVVP